MRDKIPSSPATATIRSLATPAVLAAAAGLVAFTGATPVPKAHACGCFARANPATPVVQGGERIVFAMEDGQVTAHIQIQYEGAAEDFAWLVPMPTEPTLELGTDELFTTIVRSTQPFYGVQTDTPDNCPPPPPPPPPPSAPSPTPVLVERDTVGPYDYAVLRADDKQVLLDWLDEEGFFVPTGSGDAIDPYIRPDAFFLALKLQTGEDVGDLQPIVVKYRSELPQIPIVLTSVGATPDMPVLVWVLGESRAIPRNFFHTHINDALIDWGSGGSNYVDVVTRAVDEADGHHSFITEYAGSSDIMRGQLDPEGRFGDSDELAALTDPSEYLDYLWSHGYAQTLGFGLIISTQMISILQGHLPIPPELYDATEEDMMFFDAASFYGNYDFYVEQYPDILAEVHADFDPSALTAELEERVVTPTLNAGQIFRDHPYLTRLFTTLSPDEMLVDPVFSFNPDLPDVSNFHLAEVTILECTGSGIANVFGPTLLVTEQGWRLYYPNGLGGPWSQEPLPASFRIEMLREEGAPQVVTDNEDAIADTVAAYEPPDPTEPGVPTGGGCAGAPGSSGGAAALLLLGLAVATARRRRRRA